MSVFSVKPPPAPVETPNILTQGSAPAHSRGADGDTAAQEALETRSTNQAERANGGFAPRSGSVNKTA
jgi:hypothetical protein